MRTAPLIGNKAWFGPRRFGWGLGPVSAEGWILTAITGLLGIIADRRDASLAKRGLLLATVILIALLKGTAPGGPKARRAFEEARRAAASTSQAAPLSAV
jgi:hypothetical protein